MSTVRSQLEQYVRSELNITRFPPDAASISRKTVARLITAFIREHDDFIKAHHQEVTALQESRMQLDRQICTLQEKLARWEKNAEAVMNEQLCALQEKLDEANKTIKLYELGFECAVMAYAQMDKAYLKLQEMQDEEEDENLLYKEFYEAWSAFIEAASHFVNSDYESASKRWSRARKALAEYLAAREARA